DLVGSVLEESAKFASEILAPLNRVGDRQASRLEAGVVRTPDGFKDAYARLVEAGWNGVPFEPEHGGQGLPWVVAIALQEMFASANLSFYLCPMLNTNAIELLQTHNSAEQKRT